MHFTINGQQYDAKPDMRCSLLDMIAVLPKLTGDA